jgi:hypothetical protein
VSGFIVITVPAQFPAFPYIRHNGYAYLSGIKNEPYGEKAGDYQSTPVLESV